MLRSMHICRVTMNDIEECIWASNQKCLHLVKAFSESVQDDFCSVIQEEKQITWIYILGEFQCYQRTIWCNGLFVLLEEEKQLEIKVLLNRHYRSFCRCLFIDYGPWIDSERHTHLRRLAWLVKKRYWLMADSIHFWYEGIETEHNLWLYLSFRWHG